MAEFMTTDFMGDCALVLCVSIVICMIWDEIKVWLWQTVNVNVLFMAIESVITSSSIIWRFAVMKARQSGVMLTKLKERGFKLKHSTKKLSD